jgi:hypothetical protein
MSTISPDADPQSQNQLAADQKDEGKSLLNEHKGKLAIGVAATVGAMIFYNWWERRLAKQDPDDYRRLKKLKASVRTDETKGKGGTPAAAGQDAAEGPAGKSNDIG